MPFSLIPFALLLVPVLEITAFIVIGSRIGVLATLALVVLTAAIGSVLLRVQGFGVLSRIRAETEAGRLPGREVGDGAMILAAGLLLLTPGFVTDTIGFLLFIPTIRASIWRFLASRVTVVVGGMNQPRPGGPRDGVVDLDPDDFSETKRPPREIS